jgi:putative flippase GtrA
MGATAGVRRSPARRLRRGADGSPRSGELASFVAVGLACTAAYALLYTLLRGETSDLVANALALLLTMGANFEANRRFTFRASRQSRLRQAGGYVAAYAVGLGASSLALVGLLAALGEPGGLENTVAALAAGLVATVVRYALMRKWVFRSDRSGRAERLPRGETDAPLRPR